MAHDSGLSIALVTETWPPDVNGVATTVACVAEGLARRGHALRLVRPGRADEDTPGATWLTSEMTVTGMPVPRYPQLRMGLPCAGRLAEAWQRERPDVVHIATEGPLGWSALRAAERLGLPVTSDYRTNFDAYGAHYGLGWLRRPIEAWLRHFHGRTGRTMVPTRALARRLQTLGHDNVTVVARGVDAERFHPRERCADLRAAWGASEGAPVVLYVGRLAAEKNLVTLAAAWDAVRRATPKARLVLVGDGPCEGWLRARCPDAIFAGVKRGAALAAHYASADLFLFPSITETWGNVTPEAMASGLPVVAFDDAAAAELIEDGRNGIKLRVGDDAAFVRRAARLALQPQRLRTLGAAARETALALDWSRIVFAFESVLRAEIARRATVPEGALPLPTA